MLAREVCSGDPYEVSHGNPIYCAPTGGSGAGPNGLGFSVVGWDPAVEEAGIDAGYSPAPDMLRAPDVAVGNVPAKRGWIEGAPMLAIEYADAGQDEEALQKKIADLLEAGTKYLWVVRLAGPRRVEVHTPGEPMQTASPGDLLRAPGVLQNPVPIEALYDRNAAEQATLTNLLQRRGYADLEAVVMQGYLRGHEEGRKQRLKKERKQGRIAQARRALRRVLTKRGFPLPPEAEARIDTCRNLDTLERWLERAIPATSPAEIFGAP